MREKNAIANIVSYEGNCHSKKIISSNWLKSNKKYEGNMMMLCEGNKIKRINFSINNHGEV